MITQLFIAIPSAIAIFFIVFYPYYVVDKVLLNPGHNSIVVNKIFWTLYTFSFSLSLFTALGRLFYRFKEQGGFLRVQLTFIILSILIPATFGMIFNIILLFFDYFIYDWLGAFLTVVASFLLSYFIFFEGKKFYLK